MSQYQLIAFDMDGTLLNSNKQISPETLNAIKRATDAGKTVILCTGRNLAELNAFTEIIPGLRYLDCVSGACVYDLKEKKTLYFQALDPGIVKKLMEFGMEEGAMIHVLSERSIVQKDQQSHMADFHMGIYQTMFDQITDKLDAVGNTTAAMGKGFAIGSAALTALALFVSYAEAVHLKTIDILDSRVIIGMLIGGMLPFLFSAMTMSSVSRAAYQMIEEVRRQFKTMPGIMKGTEKPDYKSCVAISTTAALKEMLVPGVMAVLAPLVVGILLGPSALGGLLAGALVTGVMMAIFMSNAGGAWDNAKKYIEDGNHGGKGSEAHKAAVVGDTVGDPFKDTSGPSINILIKLMTVVSLVFAPLFLSIGGLL